MRGVAGNSDAWLKYFGIEWPFSSVEEKARLEARYEEDRQNARLAEAQLRLLRGAMDQQVPRGGHGADLVIFRLTKTQIAMLLALVDRELGE